MRVLEAGEAPRRPLRYTLAPGSTHRVVAELEQAMQTRIDGQAVPAAPVTTMVMGLAFEILERAPNGETTMRWSLESVEVRGLDEEDAELAGALRTALEPLRALAGRTRVNDRGLVLAQDVSIPEGLPELSRALFESMRSQWGQLSTPFPVEPVGAGARWEVVQHVSSGGVALEQVTQYTVASVLPDGVHARVSVTNRAEPQWISLPGGGEVTRVRLVELSSSGEGEVTLRTTLPVSPSALTLSSRTVMQPEGATGQIESELRMRVGFREAGPEGAGPAPVPPATR